MILFDKVLAKTEKILLRHEKNLPLRGDNVPYYINIDPSGRAVLMWDYVDLHAMSEEKRKAVTALCEDMVQTLGKHTLLFEEMPIEFILPLNNENGAVRFMYGEKLPFPVIDRMLAESRWSRRLEEDEVSQKTVVFYSLKGGMGVSTAVAATARHLASQGKRVLVLDMNMKCPGMAQGLIERRNHPRFGLVDWLVEDIVDLGDVILGQLCARSPLGDGTTGDILVAPAHGIPHGTYVSKLHHSWMSISDGKCRRLWPERLKRLLQQLDQIHQLDCILVDTVSGIDPVASACVLELAPALTLIFGHDDPQTWTGLAMLFDHWKLIGQTANFRKSLQMVAAPIPSRDQDPLRLEEALEEALDQMRDSAWQCFSEGLYDSGPVEGGYFFERDDPKAPHSPWLVRFDPALFELRKLHQMKDLMGEDQMLHTFAFLRNLDEFFQKGSNGEFPVPEDEDVAFQEQQQIAL